ncbi:MAG TPA: hypothetical protein VGB55_08620 [Tepidisphaeraceae bacterium]|jgi:hypothetical protein
MRQWGFPVPADELVAVEQAAAAFRDLWASIRPPWPHAFDGSVNDVRAIDYLHYEGIGFPKCGVEGAALVCGEVLRRAARLEWVCSYRGDWFVASPEDDWPGVAICPVVRVHEVQFAGTPQFGRFMWFLSRAAIDCVPVASADAEADLRKLLVFGDEYVQHLGRTINELPGAKDK